MLLILEKTVYVLVIVMLNIYICSYLGAKLSARMELRRGYRETRAGGIGFPAIRFSHASEALSPTGHRIPRPVTTTLLFRLLFNFTPLYLISR